MPPAPPAGAGAAAQYTAVARAAAAVVLRRYSTSFSLATGMLPAGPRGDIASVYGLVRVADEIVDGTAADAGLGRDAVRAALDALEADVVAAVASGFSANPIVHAYAETAARAAFDPAWTTAFFASMRMDVDPPADLPAALDAYVYGSAEVIGLMSLHCFVGGEPAERDRERLVAGARALGDAFQIINFLRDARADRDRLGRDYLGLADEDPAAAAAAKRAAEDRARRAIDRARRAVPLLPSAARGGVIAALLLFERLLERIERRSVAALLTGERVRVPDRTKAALALRAATIDRAAAGRAAR